VGGRYLLASSIMEEWAVWVIKDLKWGMAVLIVFTPPPPPPPPLNVSVDELPGVFHHLLHHRPPKQLRR